MALNTGGKKKPAGEEHKSACVRQGFLTECLVLTGF